MRNEDGKECGVRNAKCGMKKRMNVKCEVPIAELGRRESEMRMVRNAKREMPNAKYLMLLFRTCV